MGVFDLSLLYAAIRTILAIFMAVTILRQSGAVAFVIAQAVSDLCCAVLILAYARSGVRDDVGGWIILIFGYALLWESALALRRVANFLPFVAAEDAERESSPLAPVSNLWAILWASFAVAPAIAAGFFLTLNAFAPGNWTFPRSP